MKLFGKAVKKYITSISVPKKNNVSKHFYFLAVNNFFFFYSLLAFVNRLSVAMTEFGLYTISCLTFLNARINNKKI